MKNLMRLVKNYRNLRFHRAFLMEGVRLVAFRNIEHLFRTQKMLGIHALTNDEEIDAVVDSMLDDQGMERNPINRNARARATWGPWEIYLCLLYAEIKMYQDVSKLNSNLIYKPLSKFIHSHRVDIKNWMNLRDTILHPAKSLTTSLAIQSFAETGRVFALVRNAQQQIDEYGETIRPLLLHEIEKSIDTPDVNLSNDELFVFLKDSIIDLQRPFVVMINAEPYQTPFNLQAPHVRKWLRVSNRASASITDPFLKRIKRPCLDMLWHSLVLLNESAHSQLTGGLPPAPKIIDQDTLNKIAPSRVGCAFLYEPLRLYQEAVKESPSVRHNGVEEQVKTLPNQDVLRNFRNGVFHVASDKVDPDKLDNDFTSSFDQFDPHLLLGQLMSFYSSIE